MAAGRSTILEHMAVSKEDGMKTRKQKPMPAAAPNERREAASCSTVTLVTILGLLMALVAGCATDIERIRVNPDRYVGETVLVRGVVDGVVPVPFTDLSAYRLRDDTEAALADAARAVADYLVDKDFAERQNAARLADRIVGLVGRITDTAAGSYRLLEQGP